MAPTPPERFKQNMITFVEDVEEMLDDAMELKLVNGGGLSTILIIVKGVISKADGGDVINVFIKRTFPHWDSIYDEDDEHVEGILTEIFQMVQGGKLDQIKQDEDLSKASSLISKISSGHVETIKTLFTAKYVEDGEEVKLFDDERKKNFWDLLKGFVKISLCHIHETRKMNDEGKYTVEYFKEIPVKDTCEKWKVKLSRSS